MTTHTQQNSPHLLGYTESLGGGVLRFPAEQQLRRTLDWLGRTPETVHSNSWIWACTSACGYRHFKGSEPF